jgi:hypothetical protein
MKKLGAIVITVLAISLLTGVLGSKCLAGSQYLYLPLISTAPPPPPVTPDQFIGSWAVSGAEGAIYYLFIESDNTFVWYDNLGEAPHFFGIWSFMDETLKGPFTIRDVGDGELDCTIAANGSMNIDFIEYWHPGGKHVPYTATKF